MAFLPAGLGLASGVLAGLSLFGEPRPPVRPPPLRVKVYILPAPGYYGGGDPGYYGGGAPGYYGGGRGTKKEKKKKKKKPHGKGSAGYQGVFGKHDVLAASGERHLCSQKLNLQSEEESESDESEEESESESDSEEEEDESDDEETVHQPAGRAYY